MTCTPVWTDIVSKRESPKKELAVAVGQKLETSSHTKPTRVTKWQQNGKNKQTHKQTINQTNKQPTKQTNNQTNKQTTNL